MSTFSVKITRDMPLPFPFLALGPKLVSVGYPQNIPQWHIDYFKLRNCQWKRDTDPPFCLTESKKWVSHVKHILHAPKDKRIPYLWKIRNSGWEAHINNLVTCLIYYPKPKLEFSLIKCPNPEFLWPVNSSQKKFFFLLSKSWKPPPLAGFHFCETSACRN